MLNQVIKFLKNPERPAEIVPITPKVFFTLLGLILVIVIPYAFALESMDLEFDNMIEELMQQYKWVVVAAAIILAPILEEPAFRLHLDYKPSSFLWGIGLSVFFLSELWFIPVAYMLYLLLLWLQVRKDKPPKLKFVVFTSAAFFGLVHLGNYTGFDWIGKFYFIPILVGVQFLLGLVLSFIRVNHGLKAAMLFHGAYNAIILIPTAIWGDF